MEEEGAGPALSNARLSRLSPGNVVLWQDTAHRVCEREVIDHRVKLALVPRSEDGKFYEHLVFMTTPIAGGISVKLLDRHEKLRRRKVEENEDLD